MNPYEILRISEQASPEEIQKAYTDLMERYSSDRYCYGGLADLAEAKRREIQAAYEMLNGQPAESETAPALPVPDAASPLTNAFSGTPVNGDGAPDPDLSAFDAVPTAAQYAKTRKEEYAAVRSLIDEKRYYMAEEQFKKLPNDEDDPEWNYLDGVLSIHSGWLDNARQRLNRALELSPDNPEYRNALEQLTTRKDPKTVKSGGGKGCCTGCCDSETCGEASCECCGMACAEGCGECLCEGICNSCD